MFSLEVECLCCVCGGSCLPSGKSCFFLSSRKGEQFGAQRQCLEPGPEHRWSCFYIFGELEGDK